MNAQPSALAGGVPLSSLEAVFEAEQCPLLRYAFGVVGRREVAEELVQDAFLRLYEHWEKVEQPRAWLFRCVRNRAFNHLRDHKRETLTSPENPDTFQRSDLDTRTSRGAEAPDAVLGRLEAAGVLHLLLQDLEERDAEILRLKYTEDMTYSEIAERVGMSVGNVGWRLHHVLKDLAHELRRAGVEGARG